MTPKENLILNSIYRTGDLFAVEPIKNILDQSSGSNQKNLLIVSHEDSLTEETQSLLSKILKAIGYDWQKDAITISLRANQGFSFIDLSKKKRFEHVILFGVLFQQLGIKTPNVLYQTISLQQTAFIAADSLTDIATDNQKKSILWQVLKETFTQ